MSWVIEVAIEEGLTPPFTPRWVRGVARRALEALSCPPSRISLLIADEPRVQELNRRYLGREGSTDVLSFPLNGEGFPTPPHHLPYLGEVVLCLPQALLQAQERGHPIQREVALLLGHGLLHLLGYDDTSPEKRRLMRREESRLLRLLSLPHRKEKDGTN